MGKCNSFVMNRSRVRVPLSARRAAAILIKIVAAFFLNCLLGMRTAYSFFLCVVVLESTAIIVVRT